MDPEGSLPASVEQVVERVGGLRQLIDAHATRPVRIVAVTKRFGPAAVAAALAAGIDDIGENYAQELAEKAPIAVDLAGRAPRWHFIGHLQRNKVRQVADIVHLWQTVDSEKLGREIAKRAPGAAVLVQLNASGAATQGGCAPSGVPALVENLRALELDVRGLMVIGAMGDAEASAVLFRETRALADELELEDCSMGMSGDLLEALSAGSTMIRVGTALFGPRPS